MDFDPSHTSSFRGRNHSVAMTDNAKDCVRIKKKNLRIGYSMNLRLGSIVVRLKSLFWTMTETNFLYVKEACLTL